MFGSYSWIVLVVFFNLFIVMMSNFYYNILVSCQSVKYFKDFLYIMRFFENIYVVRKLILDFENIILYEDVYI